MHEENSPMIIITKIQQALAHRMHSDYSGELSKDDIDQKL